MLAGERAWNLKRAFNHRLGLTRANDKLPKLLLQSLPDGGQEGHVPDMDLLLRRVLRRPRLGPGLRQADVGEAADLGAGGGGRRPLGCRLNEADPMG